MSDRRGVYFTFQGLLMAVLLLIFHYQCKGRPDEWGRMALLTALLGGSLLCLRLVSLRLLERWWFQAGLFIGDAVLASLTLRWTHSQSELYLIYFLIIFGTALARDVAQSMAVAVVTSVLYLLSAWHPISGFPHDTGFWLRFLFLWITASLLAVLSRDTEQAQSEERGKYQESLVRVGKLATLGQFAAEVAHRIKGPLTTIMVNAEVLSHKYGKSKEIVKELREIGDEAARCKEILKNLLDLGRIEEMDFNSLDLREPVRLALKSLEPQLRRYGLRAELAGLEAPLMVKGDQSLLQEAVTAVLQNALEAGRRGGTIRVRAQRAGGEPRWARFFARGRFCFLVIEDDGEGIAPGDLDKVFDPFFTTKGREGSGLGLSAALRILQKHGGRIEAASEGRGRGARFSLVLPQAEVPAERGS